METTTTERVDDDLSTPDVAIRILATAGDADQRYPVPSKQRFKAAGEGVIKADDLEHIARSLMEDETLPLVSLQRLNIAYLWADKGGTNGGYPALGRLIKASKVLYHFGDMQYVVMLAADHLREMKATRWQVEALVAHQLGHIGLETTEKGKDRLGVQGHDFEGFTWEFAHYGAYLAGMVAPAQAAASAVQMGMVWEAGEDDEEIPDRDEIRCVFCGDPIDDDGHLKMLTDENGETTGYAHIGCDYDPSIDLPTGVESEAGPVDGGAPAADWAGGFADPIDDDIDTFPPIVATDKDAQKNSVKVPPRRGRKDSASHAANGTSPLLGDSGASNGNGGHDKDDVAGILLDPDRVLAVLSQLGWRIAYEDSVTEGWGRYVNSETFAPYDTGDVESSYRAALSGRGGA